MGAAASAMPTGAVDCGADCAAVDCSASGGAATAAGAGCCTTVGAGWSTTAGGGGLSCERLAPTCAAAYSTPTPSPAARAQVPSSGMIAPAVRREVALVQARTRGDKCIGGASW